MKLEDRIAGVVFGTAIGDALGYPVEFNKSLMGKVRSLEKPGLYSDDTQMFLATLHGLMDAGTHDDIDEAAEYVAKHYVTWSNSPENNRAPGGACMHGCRQLEVLGVDKWRETGKPLAGGCGTAMRSMAYGLWFPGDPDKAALWAAEHAIMTHRHPMAQAAAAAVAAGVAFAMKDKTRLEIAQLMAMAARRYDVPTAQMIDQAIQYTQDPIARPERVLDTWRGWAGHEAVAASVYCFLARDRYEDAVLLAINSPGDSDTLGAITGALVGATDGATTIPKDWRANVENSAMLQTVFSQVVSVLHGTQKP
jgi:ADP-ribosylglycohydrolase